MLRYRSNKIYTGYLSGNYKILKKKVKEKDLCPSTGKLTIDKMSVLYFNYRLRAIAVKILAGYFIDIVKL